MTAPLRYDEACRLVAEAKTFADVIDIRDKAEALAVYGRIAKNRQLELDAVEIRFRAERKLGELLKESGIGPGRPWPNNGSRREPLTLASIGVDKKLSARAQAYARLPEDTFESLVGRFRDKVLVEHERAPRNLIRLDEERARRAGHAAGRRAGAVDDLHQLAATGFRAGAILADPAWQFLARSEAGEGRSASMHYRTSALAEMMALPVEKLAADDCALFCWIPDWGVSLALELIEAWGFAHKTTAFTWAKQNPSGVGWHMGQGYWTRANPETCWLTTRGRPQRLNADVRQLVVAPVMEEHSRKPDAVHEHVERLVAGPYLELFARRPRPGWVTWSDEQFDVGEAAPNE